MAGIRKVFIVGNLTRKPELQKSHNGKLFSYLDMATNRFSYLEGQWKKTTYRHCVLVCGKKAEICARVLDTGFPLAVEGFLESSQSENLVIAEDVHFLGLRTMIEDPGEALKNGIED